MIIQSVLTVVVSLLIAAIVGVGKWIVGSLHGYGVRLVAVETKIDMILASKTNGDVSGAKRRPSGRMNPIPE